MPRGQSFPFPSPPPTHSKLGQRTEREGEGEDRREREINHRQSRPPSRPSVRLTQLSHSKSPVPQSRLRQPLNFEPAEDNDYEDFDNSDSHPAHLHGSRPYSPFGLPRRQTSSDPLTSVSLPIYRAQEPSGISRARAHATGQISNEIPSQFARHDSVRSTGSTSRGAGHQYATSLNSDQHPSTSRERQTPASASPHDRPDLPLSGEPVRFPSTSPDSRASHGLQHFPENMKQGIPIPGGHTLPGERLQGSSLSSLNSLRSFGDVNMHRRHNSEGHMQLPHADGGLSDVSDDVVGQDRDRQRMYSVPSIRIMPGESMDLEHMDVLSDSKEAQQFLEQDERLAGGLRQMGAPVNMREGGTQKKEVELNRENDAREREAAAHVHETAAEIWEAEDQMSEAEFRTREAEAQTREATAEKRKAEARSKEVEAHAREAEAHARQAEAEAKELENQAREAEAEARELETQEKEAEARASEAEAQAKEARDQAWEAEARAWEAEAHTREAVAQTREAEARKLEAEARTKEVEARIGEAVAQQSEPEARITEAKRLEAEVQDREAKVRLREEEADRKEEKVRRLK